MINIVHPKVMGKPPIYKQVSHEVKKKSSMITVSTTRKVSTTSYMTEESRKRMALAIAERNKESSIESSLEESNSNPKNNVSTKINDCNQNIIEPNSCSFEQLCYMINDLEQNPGEKDSFAKNEGIQDVQVESINQVQAEKDYSQILGSGSTYDDIMLFLGKLEDNVPHFVDSDKKVNHLSEDKLMVHSNHQHNCCTDCSRENILRTITSNALKDELATAKLQLEEKDATIKFLKTELKTERKSAFDKLEEQKKAQTVTLQNHKNKYQNIIKRHQKFIEQIIAEKADLTEKCNTLAQRIKEMETKQQRELKVIAERHAMELQRAKEMCAVSEKIRRERWLEAKTSKIKEMTVKGLEPELRNMVEQHQREIQDLRSLHTKELQDVELRTIRRTNQQLEQLRLELTESYDKMLNEEKESMKKRYQDKLDELEASLLALKRKHFNDLQEEKRRFAEQQKKNDVERDEAIKRACEDYYEKYDAMSRKFESEKKVFQEAVLSEKEAWISNNQRQYNAKLAMAETRIRDECTKERDKQIELAIVKIEKETQQKKANIQKSFEHKIRCITEKYEADIQIAKDSEHLLKDKLESVQKRLEESENNLRNAEKIMERLNVELRDSRKLIDKLTAERDSAKNIVRQEIELEKKELEKQIASLYQELSKSNFNKEALMGQIYSRLKLVMTQKDLTVKNLLKEVDDLTKKCDHLEQLLDQQRREYILKCL